MRIGIDVSPLTRGRTGVGYYTYYLLDALLRAGSGHAFHGLSSGLGGMDLAGIEGLGSSRHLRVPTRALYKVWSWTGRPRADLLLGGIDLYHATNYFLPPVREARRVLSIYDLAFLKHPEWASPKITGPFSKGVRRFSREADAILTCSEATKRDIVELLGIDAEKIHVAHGAADAALQRVEPEAARGTAARHGVTSPYILFVSTLEPRKNVSGVLAAFERAAAQLPHALVLVGRWGWNTEAMRHALAASPVRSRIHHLGYVASHVELAALYSGADAFFFPSFYEGFGLPVLEAMRCGAPVITSDRASLPEVCGDAAEYADPEDVDGLAEALCRVAGDAALRERLRARGFSQAARFTWADCAARTLAVYEGLV